MKKLKYIIPDNRNLLATISSLLLFSISTFAQTAQPETTVAAFPKWGYDTSLYIIATLFIILLITIYVLFKVNMTLLHVISPKPEIVKNEIESKEKAAAKISLIRKVYLKMVDSVPVEKEKDVLLDHNYDGIHELDNNLPPWWKYGFYFTIVFAVVYLLYYHVSGEGKLQGAEYAQEIQIAAEAKAARLLASADNVNEETVTLLTDADGISKGKETFTKLCTACHRADAGGQVGPNLTDDYWLHGGGIKNVFKTITYGVPAKGMISWQNQLSPKQIQQVATYVLSLKGTNPPGGKDPQGDVWIEEKPVQLDSTKSDTTGKVVKVVTASVK